jgi:hypothetical protein
LRRGYALTGELRAPTDQNRRGRDLADRRFAQLRDSRFRIGKIPAPSAVLSDGASMHLHKLTTLASVCFLLATGCGGDDKSASDGGSESGTAGTAETSGTGESGSASAGDGDGDPTTTSTAPGDGDGDGAPCPIGAEGCPCTGGGGCDPGLMCDGGTCVPAAGDGDGAPGDGDGAPGDGDGAPGDGDGMPGDGDGAPMPDPYQACPNGDSDCAPGEMCVQSGGMGPQWTMCTQACMDPGDCAVDDNDECADLPGDGEFMLYCAPQVDCNNNNPCPMGMLCLQPFGMGQPSVCAWPN